jgi:enamine deaminase RidA (YjgF/YER057c/UK114 family)
MKTIHTEQAPAAIGPYSQAMVSGGLVFTSGQIPVDPVSGEIVAADIILQTEQVMKNLAAVLAAAGSGYLGVFTDRSQRREKDSVTKKLRETVKATKESTNKKPSRDKPKPER